MRWYKKKNTYKMRGEKKIMKSKANDCKKQLISRRHRMKPRVPIPILEFSAPLGLNLRGRFDVVCSRSSVACFSKFRIHGTNKLLIVYIMKIHAPFGTALSWLNINFYTTNLKLLLYVTLGIRNPENNTFFVWFVFSTKFVFNS